jgi:hypothetical protein
MIRDVFNSLNESIKKRYNPENFINSSEKNDIVHRGYLKNAEYPIRYSFMSDGKKYSNSGTHIYHWRNGNVSGVVEISHKYSPNMSGHETISYVTYENMGSGKLDSYDLHRMLVPIFTHHVKSHNPDVISFAKNIGSAADLIRRTEMPFVTSKTKNGFLAKKQVDPKTKRVLSHIKNKLNKSGGSF